MVTPGMGFFELACPKLGRFCACNTVPLVLSWLNVG